MTASSRFCTSSASLGRASGSCFVSVRCVCSRPSNAPISDTDHRQRAQKCVRPFTCQRFDWYTMYTKALKQEGRRVSMGGANETRTSPTCCPFAFGRACDGDASSASRCVIERLLRQHLAPPDGRSVRGGGQTSQERK